MRLHFVKSKRLRLGAVILFFFFLVAAQLSEHLSVSASGSLWNRALACLSLSDASSVFTVFLSKCHIRLPPGWHRSPRVQLVRLCLDRLSQTAFWGERGTSLTYRVCTCIYNPGNYRATQAFLMCHYQDWSPHPNTFASVWRTFHPCIFFYCLTCTHSQGNAGVTVPADSDSGQRWRDTLDKSQVDIERRIPTGNLRVANYPNACPYTVGGSRREPQGRHWENEQGPHRNVQWNLQPCCEATALADCATMSPYHLVILTLSTELNKK